MPRTSAGIRAGPAARLAEERPEWQTWLGLLELAWRALEEDNWEATLEPALRSAAAGAPLPEPLLNRQTLPVNAERAARLIGELASLAAAGDLNGGRSLRHYRPGPADALKLIAAAVAHDGDAVARLAAAEEVEPGALASLADLAALPLLQTCGRLLQARLPVHWHAGYCPVCAAWPSMAERRGLDRSRRLRCGRCSADWEVEWLFCIYCGERDHARLGTLVAADTGDMLKVETCASCGGYLKSIARLQAFLPYELMLQDLETVELDLIALDRGYKRPAGSPFALNLRVTDHPSR